MNRQAAASYADLGWSAEDRDGQIKLVTGTAIDALEVPRTAGILAASWWRYTEGHPDVVRGLPSLPDPRHALAVIAAGDRYLFLVQAGECPWHTQDPATTAVALASGASVIRWHSWGSRIPAPPYPAGSGPGGRAQAVWAHLPSRGITLPEASVLMHLLATAAALTRLGPHMLALDEGVLAIPVLGEPPASPPGNPAADPAGTATTFGFGTGVTS
jgi:hypothetical protein